MKNQKDIDYLNEMLSMLETPDNLTINSKKSPYPFMVVG